jgi:abortive infection bacteriophage resistance protein
MDSAQPCGVLLLAGLGASIMSTTNSLSTPYPKKPLHTAQQIALLERRGMLFKDRKKAVETLNLVNYYRLRIYWIDYEDKARMALPANDPNRGSEPHYFLPSTYFEDIFSIYIFDRKLRQLFMDAIERVEIAVRTVWSNQMSRKFGYNVLENRAAFRDGRTYARGLDLLKKSLSLRANEPFVAHHASCYNLSIPQSGLRPN